MKTFDLYFSFPFQKVDLRVEIHHRYLLSCLVKFLSNGNNDHNSAGYHLESSKISTKIVC